ncbi:MULTISPECIES: nitronate monooxygenase [Pseudomonas]|uniref:Nitronate monooxygenase n=2 Tax=Pseudomonadaceae TaxID=135621 RepID=A0A0D0KS34_9PSED|nr:MULTISPECIES: nitronate monooxygenase [Pseudomonas]KIQ02616.1 2-nitropropane dioxygenase [Pseudomonas fulva]MCW2291577.1 nitronate monooxygenase [Pseudomonas sp. BIGb0408]NYH73852.1 nitronate monooxygenase [Pseudomonas flavescens]
MNCAALGIEYPIIQAPMAGTATPALAAAVSNAGGLGSISIAAVKADAGRQMIIETRAGTRRPFNVNVFCHRPSVVDRAAEQAWLDHLQPYFAEFDVPTPRAIGDIYSSFQNDDGQLEVLLEERPPIVSFHLGLPAQDRIDALKKAGITLLASATTLEEGYQLEEAGIDVIVAQGIEAGGHRGVFDPLRGDQGIGTLALVRVLVRHLSRPVIAAGGIMDGAGIAAAMTLGACAAQLGTAFILCPESAANDAYRAMLGSVRAQVTQVTTVISGRPARGILNRFMAEVGAAGHPPVPGFGIAYDAGKQLIAAAAKAGNAEFAAHWAGQGAALVRAMPAAELVAVLQREYLAART